MITYKNKNNAVQKFHLVNFTIMLFLSLFAPSRKFHFQLFVFLLRRLHLRVGIAAHRFHTFREVGQFDPTILEVRRQRFDAPRQASVVVAFAGQLTSRIGGAAIALRAHRVVFVARLHQATLGVVEPSNGFDGFESRVRQHRILVVRTSIGFGAEFVGAGSRRVELQSRRVELFAELSTLRARRFDGFEAFFLTQAQRIFEGVYFFFMIILERFYCFFEFYIR